MQKFQLDGETIELCKLLKLTGLSDTGGMGKQLIARGAVLVDGCIELRKRAKIKKGQKISFEGQDILVE
jgi:ribosome-associated protein